MGDWSHVIALSWILSVCHLYFWCHYLCNPDHINSVKYLFNPTPLSQSLCRGLVVDPIVARGVFSTISPYVTGLTQIRRHHFPLYTEIWAIGRIPWFDVTVGFRYKAVYSVWRHLVEEKLNCLHVWQITAYRFFHVCSVKN